MKIMGKEGLSLTLTSLVAAGRCRGHYEASIAEISHEIFIPFIHISSVPIMYQAFLEIWGIEQGAK